ncbi:MAG: TIGR04211 family SH3 domain-containing protein [Alcanivoracaceae bacterium]|nr:TIGR04211 family SH3 domain-containing protein [Alcanivoracaceae bacterium]
MRLLVSTLIIATIGLTTTLWAAPATAAPGWISDTLFVPVRSGAGNQYRIVHRGLKTGTQLEIIAMEEGAEWAQVRIGDIEGYINAQYVVRTPPAMIRLEQLEKQHEQARKQLDEARQQVSALTSERNQLAADNKRLGGELNVQSEQVSKLEDIAADPIRLDRANRELNEELSRLRTELNTVTAENSMLRGDKTSSMWLVGASILIGGWLIGWLMRSRSSRARSSWA